MMCGAVRLGDNEYPLMAFFNTKGSPIFFFFFNNRHKKRKIIKYISIGS